MIISYKFINYSFIRIVIIKPIVTPRIITPLKLYPGVDSRLNPGIDDGCSHDLPLHPRIYPTFCDLVRCLRIPKSTPPSQNIPLLFNKCICVTLQESTPPSQNISPLFNNYMQPSENLTLFPRIHPPF